MGFFYLGMGYSALGFWEVLGQGELPQKVVECPQQRAKSGGSFLGRNVVEEVLYFVSLGSC